MSNLFKEFPVCRKKIEHPPTPPTPSKKPHTKTPLFKTSSHPKHKTFPPFIRNKKKSTIQHKKPRYKPTADHVLRTRTAHSPRLDFRVQVFANWHNVKIAHTHAENSASEQRLWPKPP